ncbi:MAG: hypothetical protein IKB22_09750 [Lentisphaeria bacterium]|nr:hypothetical protein [Lentisphaeria bacterium]
MKTVISILLFPCILVVLAAWGCYAFYCNGISDPLAAEFTSKAHTFKAFLYMAMGIGLPGAILCSVCGSALVVLSFIFKSWSRAVISGLIAASGVYIWLYFLNVDYPV